MKKQKRRLTIFDIGGIKPQPLPQEPTIDPEVKRLEQLKLRAHDILAENERLKQEATQREQRIERSR